MPQNNLNIGYKPKPKTPQQVLKNLKQSYIFDLIDSGDKPDEVVQDVLKAVMVLIGSEPTWDQALKEMRYPKFLDDLNLLKTDNIPKANFQQVKEYTGKFKFKPSEVALHSTAAGFLCDWVLTICQENNALNQVDKVTARSSSNLGPMRKGNSRRQMADQRLKSMDQKQQAKQQLQKLRGKSRDGTLFKKNLNNKGQPFDSTGPKVQFVDPSGFNTTKASVGSVNSTAKKGKGKNVVNAFKTQMFFDDEDEGDDIGNGLQIVDAFKNQMAFEYVDQDFHPSKLELPAISGGITKEMSQNLHRNLLDLNIQYNVRKANAAKQLAVMQEVLDREVRQKKEGLERFESRIVKHGEKLTLKELKGLNTVYKKNYTKQILKENDQAMQYVKNVNDVVMDDETKVADLIWGIEDTETVWKDAEQAINTAVKTNAITNGITKKTYTKFQELNILDMVNQTSKCMKCRKGLVCVEHPILRDRSMNPNMTVKRDRADLRMGNTKNQLSLLEKEESKVNFHDPSVTKGAKAADVRGVGYARGRFQGNNRNGR